MFSPSLRVVLRPASVEVEAEEVEDAERQTSEQAREEEEDLDSFFSHFAQTCSVGIELALVIVWRSSRTYHEVMRGRLKLMR